MPLLTQSPVARAASSGDELPAVPAKRIAVLHLIHSTCHGGIESALINWVRYFNRERFNVHVACFMYDRNRELAFLRAAQTAGIEVQKIPWGITKPFLKAARAVATFIKEHNIDILHTHAYYADAVGAIVSRMVRVKTVATVYVWGKYELRRQIMHVMDRIALQFFDKVTAHCEDTARKTVRLGFHADEITTLIAGFPAHEHVLPSSQQRRELRRAMGIGDDELLLVNVARIHREKAHDQLLRSFGIIHSRYPQARLWISGVGSRQLEQDLFKLRKDFGLESSVSFLGFHQDLWPILDSADIMVHPSHVEGVPIALLYGMAAQLPIVVSNVGGVSEVVHHGRTGVLVAENDEQGFADAVMSLIQRPDQARALGKEAHRFVENEYSIQFAVQRVEQTYCDVLSS